MCLCVFTCKSGCVRLAIEMTLTILLPQKYYIVTYKIVIIVESAILIIIIIIYSQRPWKTEAVMLKKQCNWHASVFVHMCVSVHGRSEYTLITEPS